MSPALSDYDYIEDYDSANRALDGNRKKTIGNNTKLVKTNNGDIRVLLHGNGIMRFKRNSEDVLISDGGYRKSQTTKDRLNRYTPAHISIVKRGGQWNLKNSRTGSMTEFYNGMNIYQ